MELSVFMILDFVLYEWNISIIYWWVGADKGKTEVFRNIPDHFPLCPLQFLHRLAWGRLPPICVGFMTDKMTLWNVYIQVPRVSCVSIIPSMLHIILNTEYAMRILYFLYVTRFPKGNCISSKTVSPVCLSVTRQSRFEDENKYGGIIEQTLFTLHWPIFHYCLRK